MSAAVGTCWLVLGLLGFATIKRLAQRELPWERRQRESFVKVKREWLKREPEPVEIRIWPK